jgi:hypothetical protein
LGTTQSLVYIASIGTVHNQLEIQFGQVPTLVRVKQRKRTLRVEIALERQLRLDVLQLLAQLYLLFQGLHELMLLVALHA